MACNMKTPPQFREDKDDYETWRKDLEFWTMYTDLPKEKWDIAVHLNLTGRVRQASFELPTKEIRIETGYQQLIEKLDKVFHQGKNWSSFDAYLALENLKREPDGSIEEYLSEFDSRVY